MARKLAPEYAHVDHALNEWAIYVRDGVAHLAWPKRTLLARLIEQGPSGAAQTSRPPLEEWPETVQRVEMAVLRLRPKERQVVTTYAFYPYPPEVCARYCQMSYSRYRTVLSECKRRIAEFMEYSHLRKALI